MGCTNPAGCHVPALWQDTDLHREPNLSTWTLLGQSLLPRLLFCRETAYSRAVSRPLFLQQHL